MTLLLDTEGEFNLMVFKAILKHLVSMLSEATDLIQISTQKYLYATEPYSGVIEISVRTVAVILIILLL